MKNVISIVPWFNAARCRAYGANWKPGATARLHLD